MKLSKILSHCALASCALGITIPKRTVDDEDQRQEVLGGKVETQKYFSESSFHQHYDGRFATAPLNSTEQQRALRNLVRTYLATFSDLRIETWLMHGALLGWWWNRAILPWDSDVDVQVSEASMFYLAAYHNMSTWYFRTRLYPAGRYYLLEINPHYKEREQDSQNSIDARWIDMESGLFVDITAARYNLTHPMGEGMMGSKDGHEFRDTYIFPLIETKFEGANVKVPFKTREFLAAEYGEKALSDTNFGSFTFDDATRKWQTKRPKLPTLGDNDTEL